MVRLLKGYVCVRGEATRGVCMCEVVRLLKGHVCVRGEATQGACMCEG